jgi:glycosyltransferase involved in cell wall biosynthesis
MRLVQLVTRLQRRGAEVFAAQLSDELAHRGHDVALVGLYHAAGGGLRARRARTLDLAGVRRPVVSPRLLARLTAELDRERPDLVQANGSDTLKYASLAKRRLRAPWPLVYRNIGTASQWLRYPAQRLWIRWLLRRVDGVASVSEASRRDFLRAYRVPASRVVMIPIGTECGDLASRDERRSRLVRAAGIDGDPPIVVQVGSFTAEKNHRWMVEAFARVLERRPDARLVLIGDGPLMSVVTAAVAARGLDGPIRFLGAREDADELVGGADLLVLPSLTEGLPGVVLEAAAREVPAVANDVGGVREVIEDGRTGYVVPVGDQAALVDRVVGLLEDPALARRMGAAARTRICERFDLRHVVDAFERWYRELLP